MARSSEGNAKTGSEDLAQVIRDRRNQLGMSRQELADTTGVPYPTIAQIETAYRGASPARLGVIARALGLDPKDLYDVLANDTPTQSLVGARRHPGTAAVRHQDASWHANPAYHAPLPPEAAETAADSSPASVAARTTDVVGQVIDGQLGVAALRGGEPQGMVVPAVLRARAECHAASLLGSRM